MDQVGCLAPWVGALLDARMRLDTPPPEFPAYTDLLPSNCYSIRSRQTLAAAGKAYVFGGMGSWNDWYPEDPSAKGEYLRVSHDLFAAVKMATVTAANQFTI